MSIHSALCQYQPQIETHGLNPSLDAPMAVAQFIESGLKVAKWHEKKRCLLLQELYLRRTFHELLNLIADPLIHDALRQQCQDQLYKPLLALKRFYKKQKQGRARFLECQREARIICHEFNPFS